ncbi:MAG: Asp-tRNA(Asn)/Glu-tRNA(Gln) amidotransferase subunit GatB [Candidatus Nanoarchaeia archaeon]|nr:Asp-tRNA(Asn)/Glu-tRNA(Gln) amidotransferase subunit GatB [Candidatus Nanoarchaeia archaeon]
MTMIGLEIHVQLATKSKMFCRCPTGYDESKPNTATCSICLGLPGSLPVFNKKVLDYAVKLSMALNCTFPKETYFSRKIYFYPDMGKNFQITQNESPLSRNGYIEIDLNGKKKKIRIRRVHMEEDPAKLIHIGKITDAKYTLMDYNRSGMPLCEIVTEPDMESPEEARIFMNKLNSILQHLGIFNPDFCTIKADANVSIEGGERVEVKNISGFKSIEAALKYEIERQNKEMKSSGKIERETRHFETETGTTHTLRKKEAEADYGYIFEPDLPVITLETDYLAKMRDVLPELPDARAKRIHEQYKLDKSVADTIVLDKHLADFFEECAKKIKNYELLANWVLGDLLKCINYNSITINDVSKNGFMELMEFIEKEKISPRQAKEVIKVFVEKGTSPKEIVKKMGGEAITNDKEIEAVVKKVLEKNKKAVDDYERGNENSFNFLFGQVMRETKSRAHPDIVRRVLKKLL